MTNNYDRCCVYDNIIIFGGYFLKVYDKLRKEQPNFHEKLVPIFGDITLPELGIKPEDLKFLCDNVNVVFHSAATIRFDEHLRYIIYIYLFTGYEDDSSKFIVPQDSVHFTRRR